MPEMSTDADLASPPSRSLFTYAPLASVHCVDAVTGQAGPANAPNGQSQGAGGGAHGFGQRCGQLAGNRLLLHCAKYSNGELSYAMIFATRCLWYRAKTERLRFHWAPFLRDAY
jgi:hypothetical protein